MPIFLGPQVGARKVELHRWSVYRDSEMTFVTNQEKVWYVRKMLSLRGREGVHVQGANISEDHVEGADDVRDGVSGTAP
jgi:hypothetical protein